MATNYSNLTDELTLRLTRLNTAYQSLAVSGNPYTMLVSEQARESHDTMAKEVNSLCSRLHNAPSDEMRQEANNLLTLAANMTSTQGGNAISSGSRAVLEYASALASITRSLRELTGDKEQ